MPKLLQKLLIALAIFTALPAASLPVRELRKLVDSSDVIVVATVQTNQQVGSGSVEINGNTFSTREKLATLHVCRVLKGPATTPMIDLRYTLLYSSGGWSGGMPKGYDIQDSMFPESVRIVFLKKSGEFHHFTDIQQQSIAVASDSCSSAKTRDDPFDQALSEVVSSLSSGRTTKDIQTHALKLLATVDSPTVLPALHAFLIGPDAKRDPTLRIEALVSILRHKDDSVLEQSEAEVVDPKNPWYPSINLILAIRNSVDSSRSVPILAEALAMPQPQLRTAAAQALYDTNSSAAIKPLLATLDDPDTSVQFAVMQGLAGLTHQYEWRPTSGEPDAFWNACLNHWHEFRQNSEQER